MITKELLKQVFAEQRIYFLKKETGIRREALVRIKEKMTLPHIHVITGLRRCGKSTLIRQIVKEFYHDTDFYYLNFEDERLLNFDATLFNLAFEALLELFGTRKTFFIDEIQHVAQFDLFVRRFYDQGFKIYLTGSNADLLQEKISARLTGRHIDTYLKPFSFTEFFSARNVTLDPDSIYQTETRTLIRKMFDEYLFMGGMPEYVIYQDNEIIRKNYEDIITRDILLRKKVKNIPAAKELYLFLTGNFAQRFSFNSLHRSLPSISINTIRNYVGYLERTYFARVINRFDFSISRQLANDKKIYVCDNAFIVNISTRVGIDKGWLLENLVAGVLSGQASEIFYFSGKKECDFITSDQKKVTAVYQVCWELNLSNEKRETEGLLEALDRTSLKHGIILTYDQEEDKSIGDKSVFIVPAWKWLLKIAWN